MNANNKLVYSGQIIKLRLEEASLPDGSVLEYEIVEHPGGAAIVAINEEGKVCLIKQYRHVFGEWLWELPAGKIDNDEPPSETAVRELREETGLSAKKWSSLGTVISSPGVFSEIVNLYLAQELKTGIHAHEKGELIEVHWFSLNDAQKMVINNTITDSKTAIGIFRAIDVVNATNP